MTPMSQSIEPIGGKHESYWSFKIPWDSSPALPVYSCLTTDKDGRNDVAERQIWLPTTSVVSGHPADPVNPLQRTPEIVTRTPKFQKSKSPEIQNRYPNRFQHPISRDLL